MSADEIEWWCEVVAALKARTTNRQGRRLSTNRILRIVTEHGVETPDRGLVKLDADRLTVSTLNRHMRRLGYDAARLTRERPAVRYQAERSNMLWHFDMSPSDLKQLKAPSWFDPDRAGAPTLMLFSVVDDRSGAAYQEYARPATRPASNPSTPRRSRASCRARSTTSSRSSPVTATT